MRLSPSLWVLTIFWLSSSSLIAQTGLPLFDSKSKIKMVQQCVDHLYNMEIKEAERVLDDIKIALPGHPATDMIEALLISWQEMPFNSHSPGYKAHVAKLQLVIEKASTILKNQPGNQEGIFFEMSARGLLAEYYADEESYMKAVSEAKHTYDFIKLGFELTDENPEFLFTVGLYNYFREKYPERHPMYKPFLWFFKSGNKEVGLKQLDMACRQAVLTKVEAHLYTSYIYLRYENDPESALKYLRKLHKDYPINPFFQAKLGEALVMNRKYEEALPVTDLLIKHQDPYYRMSAYVFLGAIAEKNQFNFESAKVYYQQGLKEFANFNHKGDYYKSLIHLGLGRIYKREGLTQKAQEQFAMALELASTEEVEKEAKENLNE